MGIVNVAEQISGQDATFARADGSGNVDYAATRVYSVLLDDPATNAYDAVGAAGIPTVGASHPDNSSLKMVTKIGRRQGRLLVVVSCTYAGPESPLSAPYERSWRMASSIEPVDLAYDGTPIVNPVGDRYTGVTMPVDDAIYVVTRNEASDPVQAISDSFRTCSSHNITIGAVTFLAGTAKIKITSDRVVNGVTYYYRVTYETAFRPGPGGWQWYQEVRGRRYWDNTLLASGEKRLVLARDDDGQFVTEPVRLDATGLRLVPSDPSVFVTIQILHPVNYNLLGIY